MMYNRFFTQAICLVSILLLTGCADEAPAQNLSSNGKVKVDDDAVCHCNTPLMAAAQSGEIETMKYLIAHGADVNEKNVRGNTALHLAVLNTYTVAAEYLIAHGADVNSVNKCGDTPLLDAICGREYHHELVELLINNGANINVCNDRGETCLIKALSCGFGVEEISYLVKNGADVHAIDCYGNTVLHLAIDNRDRETLSFFLDQGVDINRSNGWADQKGNLIAPDRTPLMEAAAFHNPAMVKLLLDKGVDKNIKNQFAKQTALDIVYDCLKSDNISDCEKMVMQQYEQIVQLLA